MRSKILKNRRQSESGLIQSFLANSSGLASPDLALDLIPVFFILILSVVFFSPAVGFSEEQKKRDVSYEGIFYGEIWSISKEFSSVLVRPLKKENYEDIYRKEFLIDSKSVIREGKNKTSKEALSLKQKTAVRYFGEGAIAIVDEMFLIPEGEDFAEEEEYQKKFKYGSDKEGHGGGHGGAKKPADEPHL